MADGDNGGTSNEVFDAEMDNDNSVNTVSEELSRFSSQSDSQSSSCTSITNPFYDGPPNINERKDEGVQGNRRTSGSSHRRKNTADDLTAAGSMSQGSAASSSRSGSDVTEEKIQQRVIIFWDLGYLVTCAGLLQFVQLVMTSATLVCLVSAGKSDGGLLNLPLSWHFRIMIFVIVLTLLVTLAIFLGNLTSLITVFGFEWTFFDMVVYGLFAFLYLVGSSLVASAFDFYQKMKTDVSIETINQLVTSVILGYICMLLNGITSFMSYRKWKIQYRLYQRRKLIEEDEIDL
ncbi:unnamed protein product [Candidula unifasciata]|uniref:MARVEL domain-containing protein n=1 Tax=Candidula unifasciata TaxID=100452 RepID=A0A8S3YLH8_9EUPU|nr:unnamed protein product [Candidula unifasciata]